MQEISQELKQKAKNFNLLYINENSAQSSFSIYSYFKNAYFTTSYENAAKLFASNEIDIVVVDSDGHIYEQKELMLQLRKLQYDIPIVLITNKTDTDSLLNALDLKITKYITKPIEPTKIEKTFHSMLTNLEEKYNAKLKYKEMEEQRLKESINLVTTDLLMAMPYPMIICSNEKIIYLNDEVKKLLKEKKIDIKDTLTINEFEKIFEKKENFCRKIDAITENKNFDKKFYYEYRGEIKIFIPTKKYLHLPTSNTKTFLVVFSNVYPLIAQTAMISYQKNKIQTHNEVLNDLLTKKVFTSKEAIAHPKKSTPTEVKKDDDIEVILNTHISSKEYIVNLDSTTFQEIKDLKDLQEELLDMLTIFDQHSDINSMHDFIELLTSYTKVISFLVEFGELCNAIHSLINFLLELDNDTIMDRKEEIYSHLNNFVQELVTWRENVFFSENTVDIHYLDTALFNSSLEFQVMLSNEKQEKEDLEFF